MLQKCCGLSLYQGGIAVGWITLFYAIYALFFSWRKILLLEGNLSSTADTSKYDKESRSKQIWSLTIAFLQLGVFFIKALVSVLLILGIKHKHAMYLLPWISFEVLGLAGGVISCLWLFLVGLYPEAIFVSIFVGLWFYIFYAMISLYKKIQNDEAAKIGNQDIALQENVQVQEC